MLSATAQEAATRDFRTIWNEAVSAYRDGDYQNFLTTMIELDEMRPHQRSVQHNVAAAHVLADDAEGAMFKLEELARRGIYADLGADSDFAPLADEPGFSSLRSSMQSLVEPMGESNVVLETEPLAVLPEGVVVDEESGDLFVSSVRLGKIWRYRDGGEFEDFVGSLAHPGLAGILGMAVDNRRQLLWAVSSVPGQYIGENASSVQTSALFGFDLTTGSVQHYLPLAGEGHFLGEVIVGPDSGVYASDSGTPVVYKVNDDLTELEIYFDGHRYSNFQGFGFGNDGRLYIADYIEGIIVADILAGTSDLLITESGAYLGGIDALFVVGSRLIAIRNGSRPHRITSYVLSEDGRTIVGEDVLAANLPGWNEPTLGVVSNGQLIYNAASGWPDFDESGELADGATAGPIRIMSVALD